MLISVTGKGLLEQVTFELKPKCSEESKHEHICKNYNQDNQLQIQSFRDEAPYVGAAERKGTWLELSKWEKQ